MRADRRMGVGRGGFVPSKRLAGFEGESGDLGAPEGSTAFLRPLLSVVAILILAKAAFGFIAGWGLLKREPWARLLALVLREPFEVFARDARQRFIPTEQAAVVAVEI